MRPMRLLAVAAIAALSASCATEPPPADGGKKPDIELAAIPPAPAPLPPVTKPPAPLKSIGRINRQQGGFCTGTLIGPDKVLTTAQCLWDARLRRWTSIHDLHFLAGYHLDQYLAHRKAAAIELPADIRMLAQGLPFKASDNWAILTLDRPIGIESAVRPVAMAQFGGELRPGQLGQLVRAGYGLRQPYAIESAECSAVGLFDANVLLHSCADAATENGFPILVETPDGWRVLGLQMKSFNAAVTQKGQGMALVRIPLLQPRQIVRQ